MVKKTLSQAPNVLSPKTGIKNIGNSCYINSVFQAVAHLKLHSGLPCRSKLFNFLCSLSSGRNRSLCPKLAIREIKSIWNHQNMQEDAFDFFMSILPLLQSKKFKFKYRSQRLCSICNYSCKAVSYEDTSLMMSLNGKSLQDQVDRTIDQIDQVCTNCGKGFMMLCKTLTQNPKILAVRILRFTVNELTGRPSKISNKVELPRNLKVNKKEFTLEAVILHKSKTLERGHYTVYFPQCKILIDDEQVYLNKRLKLDYSYFYIAFYI